MTVSLDEKDKQILETLEEHAEYTTRQIAKKTLLPATTINNRIRKLRKEKVIRHYTIIPDYEKIGKGFASYILISVDMQVLKAKQKTQYDMIKALKKLRFVERADIVSGGTDIVVFVRVADVREFDEVLLKKIHQVDGIKNTQSMIVIHPDD